LWKSCTFTASFCPIYLFSTQKTTAILDNSIAKVPLAQLILYAIGQLGWSLATFGISNVLDYFYFPPEVEGVAFFPSFIHQGIVLGIFTLLGLLAATGRFLDAFLDPYIAFKSDAMTHRIGKRKIFLAIAAIPFALFAFLLFVPLFPYETTANSVWLSIVVLLYYASMSLYVVPYTALISELGRTPRDGVLISSLVSVMWALGFVIGGQVHSLCAAFIAYGYSHTQSFQGAMGILMTISAIAMLVPVFFLNENKYAVPTHSEHSFQDSFQTVWAHHSFKWFAISDLLYWVALTFIQKGGAYYVTVLLKLENAFISKFQLSVALLSFLCYLPIGWFSLKFGKKGILSASFILLSLAFLLGCFLGKMPFSPLVQLGLLVALSIIPIASFGILQNVLVADIIHEEQQNGRSGQAGMFYAVRTLMMKIGVSIATLLFPSLLVLGKSTENDLGIRLTGVVAMFFCMAGFFVFQRYKEPVLK
jgi:Na+/melibiose symporter-like transporter